jgi:hypothetical protein
MSLNAAMIQAMVDKGLSAQDIADIAKASEAKVDRTAAERQARYREKKRTRRNAVTSRRDPPIEKDHTPGSEISPDGETQNETCVRDADWPELPDWLPPKPWNAFLAMRREKRKWPTPDAVELMVGKLERWRAMGHDPTAILNTSTENSWTGIFEPKASSNDRSPHSARPTTRQSGERVAARFSAGSDRVADLVPRLSAAGGYDG